MLRFCQSSLDGFVELHTHSSLRSHITCLASQTGIMHMIIHSMTANSRGAQVIVHLTCSATVVTLTAFFRAKVSVISKPLHDIVRTLSTCDGPASAHNASCEWICLLFHTGLSTHVEEAVYPEALTSALRLCTGISGCCARGSDGRSGPAGSWTLTPCSAQGPGRKAGC